MLSKAAFQSFGANMLGLGPISKEAPYQEALAAILELHPGGVGS